MSDYQVFGLRIRSSVPLPGLPLAVGSGTADVNVHLGSQPPWDADPDAHERYRSEPELGEEPALIVRSLPRERAIELRYAEGICFTVTTDGRDVWVVWGAPLTLSDAIIFLLGPVLGYVVRRHGVLALHASAVEIDDRIIGIVGPAGAGKSTIAAALAQRGFSVATDDVLVLREENDGWVTIPTFDQIKLWEDSERQLFGADSSLPTLSEGWDKRGLVLEPAGYGFLRREGRLGGLLLLSGRLNAEDAPRIEACGGSDAILGLVANSYTNYLLDPPERAHELRAVGRLVQAVPVRRLTPHADLGRVAALAQLIAESGSGIRRTGGFT